MDQQHESLPTEVLLTLKELGASLVNHSNWTRNLHRTLLCDAKANNSDLTEDAHHHCLFGQWYYGTENQKLTDQETFRELGDLHQRVHDTARRLLQTKVSGAPISLEQYDQFNDAIHIFRSAIEDLQHKIISEICTMDHLTGVWNRYTMNYKLGQEIERSRRYDHTASIALIDFDHFKSINDQYGHLAGDTVLKNITGHLTAQLRKYDSLFRYGGEEFLLLCPETGLDQCTSIVDRIREQIRTIGTRTHEGDIIYITVSAGIAVLDVNHPPAESVDLADKALLIAKNRGRDRVESIPV